MAAKQLWLDPVKTLFTVLALGAVIAVILILSGFEQGQYHQLRQMVLNRHADLIATQPGVKNFIATRSVIPQYARAQVEAVEGVAQAHPITAIAVIYSKNNQRTPVYVIVFDSAGGPAALVTGKAQQMGANIVIDHSLAKKYNLKIGDPFMVTDFEFTVTGINNEAAFMTPFAFINYDGMMDMFLESEIAPDLSTFPLLSYLLIELAPGAQRQQVREKIEASVASVDVYQVDEIARSDVNLGRAFFGPVMGVLVSVGYVIGLLVISLVMYADINGNIKNYAVLKALGFRSQQLFAAVFFLSLLLLLIAVPTGSALALLAASMIEAAAPVYVIMIFVPEVFAKTLAAALGFAVVGGLVPLMSIVRSDPMMAFAQG